jgi:hypothetical protein
MLFEKAFMKIKNKKTTAYLISNRIYSSQSTPKITYKKDFNYHKSKNIISLKQHSL